MSFTKRRIIDPVRVNVGGKIVKRWTGWYYVEAFDSSNGLPLGKYLCPPSYEEFGVVYRGSEDQVATTRDLMLQYDDDIELDIDRQVFTGGKSMMA